MGCGHRFCRACLSRSWRVAAPAFSCPECRRVSQVREFPAVDGHLARLTDLSQELCSQLVQSTEAQSRCTRHKHVLKVFCEEDQTPLSVRCSRSPGHGAHQLSPVRETAHSFREKLQRIRTRVRKHLKEAEKLLAKGQTPAVDWRRMISAEYTKLEDFLLSEKSRRLERMKEDERASRARLSQRLQTLQDLLLELQRADHRPSVDLLQGVKQLLGRSESVLSQRAKAATPELGEDPLPGVIEILSGFRVDITLDPTSAGPCVTVSEDLRSVKAEEGWQVENPHPEDLARHYVFAEQTLSSGRQYWEVDVTQLPQWTLGIHTPHSRIKRGRNVDSCPPVFLLRCVKKEEGSYFQSYPGSLNYRVRGPVPRIGVYLEDAPGTIAFYNVLQRSLIYRFFPIVFTEPISPIFSPGPPLPGTKAGPMTLCPVDSHLCACCYSPL
ncbi:probable E3 ubiquitin-protein ligase TRIML1 [Vombatus ursinus]|uniref:probable E3 ubiquitin-protein ligase TRIML1 n=1 Tax=Vombatus ursinus TaxID=29139 RepID=UPI000FFD0093|nr:probable E3 ubiquitin-protein ligase TRIML1 [Vombatus ursinus]